MSIIAVMVNSALIGISDLADRLFPGWGTVERIVFIVFLEVNVKEMCSLICLNLLIVAHELVMMYRSTLNIC